MERRKRITLGVEWWQIGWGGAEARLNASMYVTPMPHIFWGLTFLRSAFVGSNSPGDAESGGYSGLWLGLT